MGLVARVLSFVRETLASGDHVTYTKFRAGAAPTLRGEHFGAPGQDAHPLPSDYCYAARQEATGRWVVLGYLDAQNEPEAEPGEHRLYSRDADGNVAAEAWLRADGSVRFSNAGGSMELQSGGTVVINGVQIDPQGNISTSGTIEGEGITDTTQGVTVGSHTHGVPPDTAPPTPGS